MVKEWIKEYNLGIKIVDQQHREIFELINELDLSVEKKLSKEIIDGVLTAILESSHKHFDTEEEYFKKFKYRKEKEHAYLHNCFEKRIKDLRQKYESGKDFSKHLADFLEEWLVHHIWENDKDFVELFHKNGL